MSLLMLFVLASCGNNAANNSAPKNETSSNTASKLAPNLPPMSTSTAAQTSSTRVTPSITAPTPYTPTEGCAPDPGVRPVSSEEISWGNKNQPRIALTFDAGGDVPAAPRILKILEKHHLHVTFFITGNWAQQNPDLVRQIWKAGHEISNHTMTHSSLTQLSDTQICAEMKGAESVLSRITGHTTRPYFRPPSGDRDDRVRQLIANLGYLTIYWSTDTIDWAPSMTSQGITDRVMNNLGNGAIILMHAGSNVEADTLDSLIPRIQQQGYQIVTVTEVLK
jgi:peptidoglycan/xylan/chitin deacetylase (PgdA/CDA1 family)